MKKLTGPFSQLLSLADMPLKGAIKDDQLKVITDGGVLTADGIIIATGHFETLRIQHPDAVVEEIERDYVLLPGFIDCHTHICFAGSRAKDYDLRIQGKSYMEIAKAGGGIWDSVTQTRAADEPSLIASLVKRAERHLTEGVTTIEVKSGYGLSVTEELKQLRAIRQADALTKADLISTCLAAHLLPRDFNGDTEAYLNYILQELLPLV
ncbi:MAG: imidazolonepropionase, partial [Pedobacter sp.]|nr:imidazolonepropionase [Pedobacter sp.]